MWMRCLVVGVLVGCGPEGGGPSSGEGEGSGSASEGGTISTGSTGQVESTSSNEETGGTPECASVSEGDACDEPGARCGYGDDCGSWIYECRNGSWEQVDGSGCGAEPIPCSDSPMEGDGCGENHGEVCDPDGDCRDVLECDAYAWRFHAVCTAEYCAEAAPSHGEPCDDAGRYCPFEHECGTRTYQCFMGWWEFFAGAICDIPQPCSANPVPNDACDTAGETCPAPVDGWPTLVCDGSTWQPDR